MEVFISWSGEKSHKVAEKLQQWLPSVIQAIQPYFTPKDIEKGRRWSEEISKKLDNLQFGIMLLTKENINSSWILFEAGALSKNITSSHVCPILLDMNPTDVSGPLSQFQLSVFDKKDIYELLKTLNRSLDERALREETLNFTFEKWWPDFEIEVKNIMETDSSAQQQIRSDRELLEEILQRVRQTKIESMDTNDSVVFNEEEQCIEIRYAGGQYIYPIYLEQLDTGSRLLDFIFQVSYKSWCTAYIIKSFIDCVDEVSRKKFELSAQVAFCPSGMNQSVKWQESK